MLLLLLLLLFPINAGAFCVDSIVKGPLCTGTNTLALQCWNYRQCDWHVEFNANMNKLKNACTPDSICRYQGLPIASFPAGPTDGTVVYCSDCVAGSSPCVGGGTGSLAIRQNGVWSCAGGAPFAPAPVDASYITIATDATLTNERNIISGAGLSQVDGGANSALTLQTQSTEQFLVDGGVGSLSCPALNGAMQVMDNGTLEYCDGTGTLRRAAIGDASGVATTATAFAVNPAGCSGTGTAIQNIAANGTPESCVAPTYPASVATSDATGGAGVNTEFDLHSFTISSGLGIARIITVRASGTWAAGGITTANMRIKLAGTTLTSMSLAASGAGTGAEWTMEAMLTVRNISATGVVAAAATLLYENPADSSDAQTHDTSLTTVDTTGTPIIKVTGQFSTTSGSQLVTEQQFVVEQGG